MAEPIRLSIIVVSFNTREILRDCLSSIGKAGIQCSYEIIVVDNDSRDGSVEMLKRDFSGVALIENRQNALFAKANNQGAAVARGEYLLLLNSDTLVEKDNLDVLVKFLDDSPRKVACVGPIVLNDDRTEQSSGYALPSIAERVSMVLHLNRLLPKFLFRRLLPEGIPGVYDGTHKAGWISGCCMLIRRSVYMELGGLNEALEFYGEEPEFCWRLRKAGYETWLVHDASIIHLGGKSSGDAHAAFLQDETGAMRRYTALQKHTVGIRKSIVMSRIVILSAMAKYLVSGRDKKKYFRNAISRERAIVRYMKKAL